ncbi:MAG: hypothetical protein QXL94_08620 [Candidatus Parvarchaeum sp.]
MTKLARDAILDGYDQELGKFADGFSVCELHGEELEVTLSLSNEGEIESFLELLSEKFLLYVDEARFDKDYGTMKWRGLVNEIKTKGKNCIFCYLADTSFKEDVINEWKTEKESKM